MKLPLNVEIVSHGTEDPTVLAEGSSAPPLRMIIRDGDDNKLPLRGYRQIRMEIDGLINNRRLDVDGDELVLDWKRNDLRRTGRFNCRITLQQMDGKQLVCPTEKPFRVWVR